jgi:hypothetical protein
MGVLHIGPAHGIPQVYQQLGNAAHPDAAYAYKMDMLCLA